MRWIKRFANFSIRSFGLNKVLLESTINNRRWITNYKIFRHEDLFLKMAKDPGFRGFFRLDEDDCLLTR